MSDEDETPDNSDKTILSVDDDPVNQMVISSLFEAEGYNVAQAMDGFEALEYMKSNPCPDIILLDVMMPGLSGYDVLDKLREEYTPDLPVIMISAKASLADRVEGLTHFCNDYQTKPFEKNELLQRVASWIALRRLIGSSHETSIIRDKLNRTAPPGLVSALMKDSSMVTRLENVITMVIYIHKVGDLMNTHLKDQMKFLQFMKILNKFTDLIEGIFKSKKIPFIMESAGTQITVHFTEFPDIMKGCKIVCETVNEIIGTGERFPIIEGLTLDRLIRMGLACGRGIGGVVNGRYMIPTACFVEALVLAEKGISGHCHISPNVKSAANLGQVLERAKWIGRSTYILKRTNNDVIDDVILDEDLGMAAGSVAAGGGDGGAEADSGGPNSKIPHAYTQTEEEIDPTKIVVSEEADTAPMIPYEPPKKPPEPIVRRRGDMIRDELRQKIHRLMLGSQVEAISGNALLRFKLLMDGNYHMPFHR
jgi:CheY-like chemotaxis protein